VTVQFGETPYPLVLPDVFDVVRVGLSLGLHAVDHLIETEQAVGPFLACRLHGALLMPVESGSVDRWSAPHSECSRHSTVRTIRCVQGYGPPCQSRVWVELLERGACAATTDPAALHEALSLRRSHLRRSVGTPALSPVREVCHV
jgi:hypothetical protein